MPQYCVYTQDPQFYHVLRWLESRGIDIDPHLNRTRFTITDPQLLTEFLLTWADHCPCVDPSLDLATGLPLDPDLGGDSLL